MSSASATSQIPSAPGLAATVTEMMRDIMRALSDPYRPEQHYMRGPGPRWLEKQLVLVKVSTTHGQFRRG
jgi:hypothetical protein